MSDVPIPRDVVDTRDVVGVPRSMRQGGITVAMRNWMQYVAEKLDVLAAMSPINSVQYGTVTIASGATSGTATITSVDTSKSVLGFLGFTTAVDSSVQNRVFPRITLTNATTVTATRDSSDPVKAVTVSFVVTEFN